MNPYFRKYGMNPQTRLARFKARADEVNGMPHRADLPALDWRSVRFEAFYLQGYGLPGNWNPEDKGGQTRASTYYASSLDSLPGREIGAVTDILTGRDYPLGYYSDHFCDETITGYVMQLPARNGDARYYPAIAWSESDCVTAWPLEWHDTPEDAARSADGEAELAAEKSREYEAQFLAQSDISDAREEIKQLRKEAHALIQDLRASGELKPAVCEAVRQRLAGIRAELHAAVNLIADRKADAWSAISF